MRNSYKRAIVIALACVSVNGYLAFPPNQLHPVQGLYVKPSVDGTTGDLYVAASEDNGVNAKWVTDQPVNFLPVAAQAHQPSHIPVAYSSSVTSTCQPRDDIVTTQKRTVMTTQPVRYTYALPGATNDGSNALTPYPYAMATPKGESVAVQYPEGTASAAAYPYPYTSPFYFFYSQLMSSAAASAVNALKEAGLTDDTASGFMANGNQMWSPTSYAYPQVQYVMMDPSAWGQSQPASASASAGSLSSTQTSDDDANNAA